jgi:dihydroorotase-like cyclic amidohydrolase
MSWAQAAAVLVILIAGTLLMIRPDNPQNEFDVVALSRIFEQQKQNLLVDYKDVPALTDNWMEQLQELESAAETIAYSLRSDPNNSTLLEMLEQVYLQQLSLIQAVHQTDCQSI